MMKTLRTLALIGVSLLAIAIVGGLFLPSTARVQRTATIDAPEHVVFAAVNTLKLWPSWAAWFRYDTTAAVHCDGPPSGAGATMHWQSSHGRLGNGVLTVTQATPSSSVSFTFAMDGQRSTPASLRFVDAGNGRTTATWDMEADFGFNLFARWFGLFFDRMVGPDFEQSLASLDAYLAATRKRMSSVQDVVLPATHVLLVRTTTPTAAIGGALATSFASITGHAGRRNLQVIGAPFVSYSDWNGRTTTMEAMMPIAVADTGAGDVRGMTRPAMRAVAVDYYGPYELVGIARDALEQHLAVRNIPAGESWEEYLTDPAMAPDPATWHTRVYYRLP